VEVPTIHYLNVKQGDCSIIQHYSKRTTVIDVCNAKEESLAEAAANTAVRKLAEAGVLGNFSQKDYPANPIAYMTERGIQSVFRFILTNPDMDHMDFIKAFFEHFSPGNFWDTNNNVEKDFSENGPYDEIDWEFYKSLRDNNPTTDPTRLTLHSGATGQFYNSTGGDGLHILSPTPALVDEANECNDHNDCSYVILYRTGNYRVVFGGDSHDKTWEHILANHRADVENVDLLIAPHHGRDSDRSYDFLDVLNPRLTFFGNANWQHLAYHAWNGRNLWHITNNQAGCMIVAIGDYGMALYVTHRPLAAKLNPQTTYDNGLKAYFCRVFSKH
jgi:competence protein ComEC